MLITLQKINFFKKKHYETDKESILKKVIQGRQNKTTRDYDDLDFSDDEDSDFPEYEDDDDESDDENEY